VKVGLGLQMGMLAAAVLRMRVVMVQEAMAQEQAVAWQAALSKMMQNATAAAAQKQQQVGEEGMEGVH
jgi:hypothetical protein